MRFSLSLIITSLILGCKGQDKAPFKANTDNNTLLWQISGKGLKKPSYLFGTFHLMCKDDIHISDPLKNAVKRSDVVYLELDMDDPANLLGGMMLMNMKGGKQLKDLYSEVEYQKVESFFNDSLKMPLAFLQSMKPYFLIGLIYPKMMSCNASSGMEEAIMKLAKENKKEIKGLETMAFQASVFDSIPYEIQAKELLNTIDSLQKNKDEFRQMVKAYNSQQMQDIEKMIKQSDFGVKDNEELLLTSRNKNWVQQLNNIMTKQSSFIAVGAGHLVGNQGLIALLKTAGYTVTPLYNQ